MCIKNVLSGTGAVSRKKKTLQKSCFTITITSKMVLPHGIKTEVLMNQNRNYKDSVFTALFSDPDLLRELYCALKGVSLPGNVPVSINTLENVLYMDLYNDISFEIGGKLVVLIEHQSTINPNMALRLLLYIARVFEKTVKGRSIYSQKQLSIPWPEFYVLYNGSKPYPDENILRLSDLFTRPGELEHPDVNPGSGGSRRQVQEEAYPLLELEVKVININEGRNESIVSRCKKLAEYSFFMSKARDFSRNRGSKEEAIKEVVKYCKKHDILKEFLEIHASEILNMLLTEWNIEDAKEVWHEEAREEGREEGRKEGREEGRKDGLAEGRKEGREEEKIAIARNALAEGATPDFVRKITGLDMETIQGLRR